MTERDQRLRDCLLAPNNATPLGHDFYVQDGKVYCVKLNSVLELGDYFEFVAKDKEEVALDWFRVNYPVLYENSREWIGVGWELKDDPQAEQFAAALLMEAKTQDLCVLSGDSDPYYPPQLREIAYNILDMIHK